MYCIALNFHDLIFHDFVNYSWIKKILFMKISLQNTLLVNEEVTKLGTNNS